MVILITVMTNEVVPEKTIMSRLKERHITIVCIIHYRNSRTILLF